MNRDTTLRLLSGVLWVAVFVAVIVPVQAAAVEDWYVLTIAGSPVGSLRNVVSTQDDVHVETQSLQLVLNRMGSLAEMASETTTREDGAGNLLSVEMELDLSSQSTTVKAVIEPGRVLIADGAGEATFGRQLEYTGALVGPAGTRQLIRDHLNEIGDRVSYKSFRAELGTVAEVHLELVGRESELLKVEETFTGIPMQTTYWLDAQGKVVRSSIPSPFGVMETVLADAAAAKMAIAGNELPEESYGATLAHTQVRLPEPRRSDRVVLELRHRTPALGWPELTAPGQRILEKDKERLLLEIRRVEPTRPAEFPVDSSQELEAYLAANAYIQSDGPQVRSLARKIVGNTRDILTATLALERWVAENMRFDMGVVMAPSAEVLENRQGTCTEYAVLLTTLARSLGIPARFVMGYVYVGGIYGGHAWTEVLIGDRWVGFDGAVPTDGPVDAARFAFLWSSLAKGIGELNIGPGLQMYGQIDLSVRQYGRTGEDLRRFSPDEEAIEIVEDVYRYRILEVTWSKPASFSFVDLDLVWPETGLVGIAGPDGEKATLSVRDRRYWLDEDKAVAEALKREIPAGKRERIEVAGRETYFVSTRNEAALAVVRGSELWLLRVEAPRADARLRELAEGLEL